MSDAHLLFADLEATLTNGAGQQRFTILRKITDLFLAEVDSYSDDHVAVFDQLMSRLIDRIERQALVELSGKLAPVGRAPANVIGLLSNNDDIDVAGPVLAQSGILTDEELVAIAESKSQAHLVGDRRPQPHQRADHRRADRPRQRRGRAQDHGEPRRPVFPLRLQHRP